MIGKQRTRGFTLIELLVALAVFALVAAAAVVVMRQSIDQRDIKHDHQAPGIVAQR